MNRFFSARFWLLILFAASACTGQSQSSYQLELLGQTAIPYNQEFKQTPIGGLSGLTYDPESGLFYVVSDDRSELADGRFYSFRVELNEQGMFTDESIKWLDVHFMKNAEGSRYREGQLDPEGIALGPDSSMYISSEGDPTLNVAPFVNAYTKTGSFSHALTIPPAYWLPDQQNSPEQGVRINFGFEGLAITPDGNKLYAGTENALLQDGTVADSASGSPSRIIVYEVPSGKILNEYMYKVDAVYVASGDYSSFAVNGLTALVMLNNEGNMLSLDRNYVAGQGTNVSLYAVSTEGATDIKGTASMQKMDEQPQPVQKTLLANLSDFDITMDNFEGLVLGPELADGGRLLLIVSDNNFSSDQQTLFTAFKLKYE